MATIKGKKKNDVLKGTSKTDEIFGLAGDDRLIGKVANDKLYGGGGNDELFGADGNDKLKGGGGNDKLFGEAGEDKLKGGAGDDFLDGGDHNDMLDGGAGNDLFIGGAGADAHYGGDGIDTVSFAASASKVEVDLLGGFGTGAAQGDTFAGIENVEGSAFNDHIEGDGAANLLRGLDGKDVLFGGAGDDRLEGGEGDDLLAGGSGADAFVGGGGFDTVTYIKESSGVSVHLATGTGNGAAGGDTFESIEEVIGSQFADVLHGDDNANWFYGMDGIDVIAGKGGNDFLFGGNGADLISGDDGDDWLVPEGDDGLAAADGMVGGDGNDWVDYSNAGGSVAVNLTANTSGAAAAGDSYQSIENVLGSNYDDTLYAGVNGRAYGGAGKDFIADSTETEILRGGIGSDILSDVQNGEDFNKDIFVIGEGLSSDTVFGFTPGTDLLWLPKEIADNLAFDAQGKLISDYILNNHAGNFATASSHAQLVYHNQKLSYDSDGTGAAAPIEIAHLSGGPQDLWVSDFQLALDI